MYQLNQETFATHEKETGTSELSQRLLGLLQGPGQPRPQGFSPPIFLREKSWRRGWGQGKKVD